MIGLVRANTRLARTVACRVQRCLHLFRVHLGAAHIDYPAASTNKMIPVPASLDHVARIDEAFVIGERE